MIEPTIPVGEEQRLKALESYNILDTLPEQEYDDFTRIAAQICDVPIALISLVDENRQWFKSKQGLDATQTPRAHAFCAHAINMPNQLFEVTDATKDPRFHDNPLVTGEPNVIFYVGSPLVTPNGDAIGTLCVIDNKPREISQKAKETLQLLSRQVITTLELRKKNTELERLNKQLISEIEVREQKEQELVKTTNRAVEAEKVKDDFLANISHELYTPMNGIVGFTNLLLEDQSLSSEHRELVEYIKFSSTHLSQIVHNILDFTNISKDKILLEFIDFDFPELLRNLYHKFLPKAKEKGIEFKINNDVMIPSKVNGDPKRLEQILLHLTDNAIKFTSKGLVSISTKLLSESSATMVLQFEVKDTGIGIPKDKLDDIFVQFNQSNNKLSREYEGTGIGLSIVKKLIKQFGGIIKVDSVEGFGSVFKFTIQLNQASKSAEPALNGRYKSHSINSIPNQ